MKYYLCIVKDGKNYVDESSNVVYPVVGSIYVSKNDEFPECAEENDEWVEIPQEEYDKYCENYNHIIKYDGTHCIGTCQKCRKCIDRLFLQDKEFIMCEDNDKLKQLDSTIERSCCII